MLNHIYHVGATNENNLSKIYVNSIYDNEKEQIVDTYSQMNKTNIGRYDNTYTKGNIYSIRMYNRALTQEEITHNYEIDKHRFKF